MSNTSSPISVAVVDDQFMFAEMMAMAITKESDLHLSGVATTITDAIELIDKERPNVVLMDYAMPDIDNIEAIKTLLSGTKSTQFILLSSNNESEEKNRALEAGCAQVLPKDLPLSDVLAAVRSAVNAHEKSIS